MAGKEICQLYAACRQPRFKRPPRELKAFTKVALAPGERRTVTFTVPAEDLQLYDTARGTFLLDDGVVDMLIGASSRDIRLSGVLRTLSAVPRHRKIEWDTQPVFVLANPVARAKFNSFLQKQLSVDEPEADRMLEHCANSFFGIFTTFDRRFRQAFPKADIEALLADIDEAMTKAA